MIDMEKGKVSRQITKGDWVVRRVLKVDEDNQVIYFTASGVNPKGFYAFLLQISLQE